MEKKTCVATSVFPNHRAWWYIFLCIVSVSNSLSCYIGENFSLVVKEPGFEFRFPYLLSLWTWHIYLPCPSLGFLICKKEGERWVRPTSLDCCLVNWDNYAGWLTRNMCFIIVNYCILPHLCCLFCGFLKNICT